MPRVLDHVAWEACLVEPHPDKGLEAYARRKTGMPAPSIRYFAPVPWLARALVDLHPEYGLLMYLGQDVADLLTLVVSQENSCRFCYAAQRALLWGLGMERSPHPALGAGTEREPRTPDGRRYSFRAEPIAHGTCGSVGCPPSAPSCRFQR